MLVKSLECVRSAEDLSEEDLISLFRGDVLAIRIKGFCPPEVCEVMNENLMSHPQRMPYPHNPTIERIMESLFESYRDEEKRMAYYRNVPSSTLAFRKLSGNYLNPMDRLRLTLEDVWKAGAQRENIEGHPMSFGIGQIFQNGGDTTPHQDSLKMDEPDNPKAQALLCQCTALVYTLPAKEGGLLELWREHLNGEEFAERKSVDSYGLDRSLLPPSALTITPEQGELVIADSTKVHSVTKITSGPRIAVNCFIGFRGVYEPLTFWS